MIQSFLYQKSDYSIGVEYEICSCRLERTDHAVGGEGVRVSGDLGMDRHTLEERLVVVFEAKHEHYRMEPLY